MAPRYKPSGSWISALLITSKICESCSADKPIEDFSLDGKSDVFRKKICQACVKKHAAERAARYEKGPTKGLWRGAGTDHRVFVSHADYDFILEKQNHCCAVCQAPLEKGKRIHLDHDHKTKRVRGILHPRCNAGLGYFFDDPATFMRAATYLMLSDPLAQDKSV